MQLERNDLHRNLSSRGATTATITDIKHRTVDETPDVENVVRTTKPRNVKTPLYVVNVEICRKPGMSGALRLLLRKSGWKR